MTKAVKQGQDHSGRRALSTVNAVNMNKITRSVGLSHQVSLNKVDMINQRQNMLDQNKQPNLETAIYMGYAT